jgi:hypothetical protein
MYAYCTRLASPGPVACALENVPLLATCRFQERKESVRWINQNIATLPMA